MLVCMGGALVMLMPARATRARMLRLQSVDLVK